MSDDVDWSYGYAKPIRLLWLDVVVRRTWRDRLFSWPWCPWRAYRFERIDRSEITDKWMDGSWLDKWMDGSRYSGEQIR